jgi:hypothetical protein
MKKTISTGLIILASLVTGQVNAQSNKLKFEVGYNVSAPVGNFRSDYISNTSFRGGYGGVSYQLNPSFAVGLNVGYQTFYQRYGRQTYKTQDNQTVSAVLTNTVDLMPVLIKGTYYPLSQSTAKVQPYVAGGAGVNFVSSGQYLGEFGGTDIATPLALQAGAGLSIPVGRLNTTSLKIGANYNYVPYNKNGSPNFNTVGVNAGITFPLR